jgi:hypothetical protein
MRCASLKATMPPRGRSGDGEIERDFIYAAPN